MTHDFIHTSLYCRFHNVTPSIRECNKKKKRGGVTVVVFKLSEIENVNFASFSTRHYIMAFCSKVSDKNAC